jgi:hypothetical protein
MLKKRQCEGKTGIEKIKAVQRQAGYRKWKTTFACKKHIKISVKEKKHKSRENAY